MADQISDSEIVGLFRELQAIDAELIDVDARVRAAYEEWRRISDARRATVGRRSRVSQQLEQARGSKFDLWGVELASPTAPPAPPRAPFCDKEHDIWTRAYALAFESENGNASMVHRAGSSRATRAALAADEAVRLYGESSNGTLKRDG